MQIRAPIPLRPDKRRKKGKKLCKGAEGRHNGPAAVSVGNALPLPFFWHHLLPGLNKMRKNTANTRTMHFGRRLLSL